MHRRGSDRAVAHRAQLAWVPLGAAMLAALLAWLIAVTPWLQRLDDALTDAQLRWVAAPPAATEVLVLDIDEASLRLLAPAFGGWPLRREAYALVIDYLREAGVRLVALDVVLADAREGDAALARALSDGRMPVVLAAAALLQPLEEGVLPGSAGPGASSDSAVPAASPDSALPAEGPAAAWPALLMPAQRLRRAAGASVGLVTLPLDSDGVLRRLPVLHGDGASRLAALPVATVQALAAPARLAFDAAEGDYRLGGTRWPADAQGRLRLPGLAVAGLPRLPFHLVARAALGQPAPGELRAQLAGRVVFIGSSAGLGNRVMTPAGPVFGAEWLAASHAALAAGQVIRPPTLLSALSMAALGLLPSLLLWWRGRPAPVRDALAALLLAGLALGIGATALAVGRAQWPVLLALGTLAAGALLALAAQQRHARQAAERLRHERAVAEAANAAKSEFLANMSHELRTPLNGVIGACQLLQDHGGDELRREELLDIIRVSSNHLLGLIDGVLHLARIESGVLELVGEDFNLVDAVEAVMATAAAPARGKGLQVACVFDPGVAAWRHGDVTRLRQVLLNLLGNAVKFTLHGEVVLRVEPGATPEALRLRVSDSGIGLDAAAQQRIFEPFAQADSGTTRRFGGSGLGLTICRKLVQAMGGRITVESRPGEGSTFTVELALPLASRAEPEPPPLGLRVAFIEPHEASAQALAALLQRMGCQALRCTTAQALHEACTWPDAQGRPAWLLVATDAPEALALMDEGVDWIDFEHVIGMSRQPWYAAESVRDQVRLPRSVLKPVLRSALVSRFGVAPRHAVASAASAATAAGSPVGAAPPSAIGRVLVVEDDPVNQTIVSAMLGQAGFHAEVAADGRQALRRCAEEHFDVVLMDWQMPDMDGIEVTRRLRDGAAGPRGVSVPVVALTANAFAEDRAACLAAGMNDFLSKPVVAEDLVSVVSRWSLRAQGR